MAVSPSNAQDTLTVIAVLIGVVACVCVAYWRTALKVILIMAVALAVFGVVAVIYGLAWLMAAHG